MNRRQLGDVVLAAEVVLAEAAEAGIRPLHHLQHLLAHGLLHLLGYAHETDDEAAEMERLEVEILGRIGVADPYSRHRA
jgi:probable rRNA maturation factor